MIAFLYTNSAGKQSEKRLLKWQEHGGYIQGFCEISDGFRTFRKDRMSDFSAGKDLINWEYEALPLITPYRERKPKDTRPQICFTGFKSDERNQLEKLAEESGLKVVKSATKSLSYLCGGSNAGSAKIQLAHEAGAFIFNKSEFLRLLDTGEIDC